VSRRLVVASLAVVVAAAAAAAGAGPSPCAPGRFVAATPAALLAEPAGTYDVVVVGADAGRVTVAVAGRCPPARARWRAARAGTRLGAAWPRGACGAAGRVRVKAIVGEGCEILRGTIRTGRARPVPVVAARCADDGVVRADAGEECAGADGCPPGRACVDCRCVPSVGFARDVLPLLGGCLGSACHDGDFPPGGVRLAAADAYEALRTRAARGGACAGRALVLPGAPDASVLVARLTGATCGTRMPAGRLLPPAAVDLVRWWIAEGAPP
jgi:hypothetical protein